MRIKRAGGIAGGMLAIVAVLLVLLVLATAPRAAPGELLLPAKTDFTKGRFFAYAAPWGAELSPVLRPWARHADKIAIDLKRFPQNTSIHWRWPPIAPHNGAGVWGYDYLAYDNYGGGITEQVVPPTRLRDVRAFEESFRWTIDDRFGDANVLSEFYLRSSPTDPEADLLEIGWFLHAPANMRRFFEHAVLIGRYRDPAGREWTVRRHERYCMFAPVVAADVPSGRIDMLHALGWLRTHGLVTGDEWVWGIAIGAEPVRGIGTLTVQQWAVRRN